MTGKPLADAAASDAPVHEYVVMGYFGSALSVTDGRYKLMRAVRDTGLPIYEYTQMPTHMNRPFAFTKGTPVMRIVPDRVMFESKLKEDMLFDLERDPREERPIADGAVSRRLTEALTEIFRQLDAPEELYARYGLTW